MKHKKDLPRRFWKYVQWALVDRDGQIKGISVQRSNAFSFLRCCSKKEESWTVKPVLCLPVSIIDCTGALEPGLIHLCKGEV